MIRIWFAIQKPGVTFLCKLNEKMREYDVGFAVAQE
jgi:hypothetical protein